MVVEAQETTTIKAFQEWGFTVVPVPFRNFLPFGERRGNSLFSYTLVSKLFAVVVATLLVKVEHFLLFSCVCFVQVVHSIVQLVTSEEKENFNRTSRVSVNSVCSVTECSADVSEMQ